MVKIKDMETIKRRYAKNSLRAFLEGSQHLSWIIGVIRSSGISGQALDEFFREFQGCGDSLRFHAAYQACREQGWL